MRWRWLVVLLLALAVVSAQPASAAHVAAYDSHTTDTEFNNAQTLDNVSVRNSGQAGLVSLEDIDWRIDSFEDGDLAEYTGSTADWSVTTSDTTNGTLKLDPTTNPSRIVSTPGGGLARYYDADSGNVSVDINLNGTNRADILFNVQDIDNAYQINVGPNGLDAEEWDGGTRFGVPDVGRTDANVPTNEFLTLTIDHDGSIASATLRDSAGNFVADIQINMDDQGDGIGFRGNSSDIIIDHMRYVEKPDKKPRGTYVSANYSVERVDDGWANLSLSNAAATVTWQGTNGNTWTDVATVSYTSGGNRTVDLSGTDYDTWRVNVTYERQSGTTTARLHDEGIRWQTRTPNVDDGAASPTGTVSGSVALSIPVADGDFGLVQGDSVDVEFFTKGPGESSFSSEGTDTLTSNGTASVSDTSSAGQTEWYAVATDSEGNTIQSDTFTYSAPGQIRVYNETAPNQLVDDREVTATIHVDNGSDTVIRKRTSNGTVPLGSITDDAPLTVVFNTSGYYNTTYRYPSPFGNYSAYLLNSTIDIYDVRFTLTDRTGQFPADNTSVLVQRPLNQSGNLKYRTVTSDVFGAGGTVKTKLKRDQRYRVVIRNRDGDTRILGPYVADRDELVELEVGVLRFSQGSTDGYSAEASYKPEPNGPDVLFNYSDPANETDQLRVIITNRSSGNVVFNQSFNNVDSLQITEARPENDTASYRVEWRGDRAGVPINGSQIVGPNRSPGIPLSAMWQETFAIALIVVVAGGSVGLDPAIGAIGTALVGGLMWFIGWLPPVVGGGIMFVAIAVGVLVLARRGGAPAP